MGATVAFAGAIAIEVTVGPDTLPTVMEKVGNAVVADPSLTDSTMPL